MPWESMTNKKVKMVRGMRGEGNQPHKKARRMENKVKECATPPDASPPQRPREWRQAEKIRDTEEEKKRKAQQERAKERKIAIDPPGRGPGQRAREQVMLRNEGASGGKGDP